MDGWGRLLLSLLGYGSLRLWNTYLYTPHDQNDQLCVAFIKDPVYM